VKNVAHKTGCLVFSLYTLCAPKILNNVGRVEHNALEFAMPCTRMNMRTGCCWRHALEARRQVFDVLGRVCCRWLNASLPKFQLGEQLRRGLSLSRARDRNNSSLTHPLSTDSTPIRTSKLTHHERFRAPTLFFFPLFIFSSPNSSTSIRIVLCKFAVYRVLHSNSPALTAHGFLPQNLLDIQEV
jgi:hypothetical protein